MGPRLTGQRWLAECHPIRSALNAANDPPDLLGVRTHFVGHTMRKDCADLAGFDRVVFPLQDDLDFCAQLRIATFLFQLALIAPAIRHPWNMNAIIHGASVSSVSLLAH